MAVWLAAVLSALMVGSLLSMWILVQRIVFTHLEVQAHLLLLLVPLTLII
tara:strand:- start:464 stop:613 length:150 start_codon:yes stop_codon:yes gene_type:complete